MDREEAEKLITEHAQAIRDIYKQYRGGARFLDICIVDEHISVYNSHWADGADEAFPINVYLNDDDKNV